LNNLWTVISFSLRNRMRSKAFIATTITIALLSTIAIQVMYLVIMNPFSNPDRIGFVENAAPAVTGRLTAYYGGQEKPLIELAGYPDAGSPDANEEAMKERMRGGEINGYLEFATDGLFPKVTYKSERPMDTGKKSSLQSALQAIKADIILSDANLTEEQRTALAQPVRIEAVQISTAEGAGSVGADGKSEEEQVFAFMLVYIVIILLYMGIMITGQLIATEITAEKSSRVMEILVTSVAPLTQMFGKIIGMCLLGLTQIAVFGFTVAVNLMLPHTREMFRELNLDLSSLDPMLVVYAVIFYVTGYFLYGTLYAAIGSIVSRTEELGQAVMPLTTISMVAFFLGIFGLSNPNASYVVILSYIPFFTPYFMFMRIGMADPALWEVLLSLVILLATILLVGWLSAKIYRTGVLMYGKRPGIRELRKAMKAYKA
jgi:ABC-2 type transport system permease protein